MRRARCLLLAAQHPEELRYWAFVQFLFDAQWTALRDYCAARHVGLIGDLPIYVSDDSADVWANRRFFELDEGGRPSRVAGIPPDAFPRTASAGAIRFTTGGAIIGDDWALVDRTAEKRLLTFRSCADRPFPCI